MTEEEKQTPETTIAPEFDSEAFRSGKERSLDTAEVNTPVVPESTPDVTKTTPSVQPTNQVELDEYWQEHLENMGKDYIIPEPIKTGKNAEGKPLTRKEKFELMRDEIYKNTDTGDDDFTLEYKKTKSELKENFDRNKFIESKRQQTELNSMSDDDFLFVVNKAQLGKSDTNPNGLDDETIRQDIEKMSAITKKRERTNIENEYKNIQQQESTKRATLAKERFDADVAKANETNASLVTTYLKNIEGKNNIDGIELGEADLTQYRKDIPDMLKVKVVKDKDGNEYPTTEAQEILNQTFSDESTSMTFLPILWMIKNNKFKGYTSAVKEAIKKQIETKLDPKLGEQPGSATDGPAEFDGTRFRAGK